MPSLKEREVSPIWVDPRNLTRRTLRGFIHGDKISLNSKHPSLWPA